MLVLEELRARQGARREDLRRGDRLWPGRRRLPHHRPGRGRRRRLPRHEGGDRPGRASSRPTSTTSTPTAPRRRWATRSNWARSSGCWATRRARPPCPRPSRPSATCWARPARSRRPSRVLALRDQIAPPTINLDNPSVETADRPGAQQGQADEDRRRAVQQLRLRRHQRLASCSRRRREPRGRASAAVETPPAPDAPICGRAVCHRRPGAAGAALVGGSPTSAPGPAPATARPPPRWCCPPAPASPGSAQSLAAAGVIRSRLRVHGRRQGHRRRPPAEGRRIRVPLARARWPRCSTRSAPARSCATVVTIPEGLTSKAAVDILNGADRPDRRRRQRRPKARCCRRPIEVAPGRGPRRGAATG